MKAEATLQHSKKPRIDVIHVECESEAVALAAKAGMEGQWELRFLAYQRGMVWSGRSGEAAREYARPTWFAPPGLSLLRSFIPRQAHNGNGICVENSSCLIGDLETIVFVGNLYLAGLQFAYAIHE